jgi:predicted acetyltransferase
MISLRNVTKKDWEYILKLRNTNYEYFYIQNKPINKDEHYQYMEKMVNHKTFFHWIATENRTDLGYVRIKDNDVSIIVDKKYQNKNYGKNILKLLEKKAKENGLKKLIALVDINNISSQKIFLKNNYICKQYLYEKEL